MSRCCRPLRRIESAGVGSGSWTGGTLALIPWIVYLGFALPADYLVHDWTATWVGFDLLLLGLMAATVVFGVLRRQVMPLTAFATGTSRPVG